MCHIFGYILWCLFLSSPLAGLYIAVKPFFDGRLELNLSLGATIVLLIFVVIVFLALALLAANEWRRFFKFICTRGGAVEMTLTVRPYRKIQS